MRQGIAVAMAMALAGCATIMQGSSQEVSVGSMPSGARVTINGENVGNTPVALKLARKDKHLLRIALDGYQPYEMTFTRSTSGWVWGNLVFGGIPGLAIDAITGGMYKLKPEQVQAELGRSSAQVDRSGDAIVVLAVLNADPTWEKVGQLTRSDD